MPRRSPFSAQLNFPDAAYGPLALRSLLRSRLLPGESLVGWGAYSGALPPHVAALAFALAIVPHMHFLAGFIARVEKGVMVLTDRRLMLLAGDQNGTRLSGRGIRADWPIETLSITAKVGTRERLLAMAETRALRGHAAIPETAPGRVLPPRPPLPAPQPSIGTASLFIIAAPDGRSLTLKVPYFSGRTAAGRLREGLVLLAGGTVTEGRRES